MAFIENTGSEGNFVKIIDGSLCLKSSTPKEGYTLFETKNPQTDEPVSYYVRRFKAVSGMVTGLERVELESSKIYGYNLHMQDEDGKFTIFFKDDARTTDRLLKTIENVDLNEELTIRVWKDDEGKTAIVFKQNDENVPQKWNKDNLPEPRKVKGKWDYSAMSEFLYNNVMENVIPNMTPPTTAKAATAGAGEVADSEIPF